MTAFLEFLALCGPWVAWTGYSIYRQRNPKPLVLGYVEMRDPKIFVTKSPMGIKRYNTVYED